MAESNLRHPVRHCAKAMWGSFGRSTQIHSNNRRSTSRDLDEFHSFATPKTPQDGESDCTLRRKGSLHAHKVLPDLTFRAEDTQDGESDCTLHMKGFFLSAQNAAGSSAGAAQAGVGRGGGGLAGRGGQRQKRSSVRHYLQNGK